jgi:putative Mn2+ efflux pump MntP
MSIYIIFLIALALAIDAFAVSIGAGAYFKKTSRRQKF